MLHEILRGVKEIKEFLITIYNHQKRIMQDLQALKDAVAKSVSVEESAIQLIQGLKQQLDDAIASEDPAALQQLSDQLGAEADKLADAVTANTSTAGVGAGTGAGTDAGTGSTDIGTGATGTDTGSDTGTPVANPPVGDEHLNLQSNP